MITADVVHRYEPRGAARHLFENRGREILLSGPAGTGKSRACLEKLHMQALKWPGMRGLILRKTQKSLGSTALVTFREQVAAEAIAQGIVRWYGGSQQEAAAYRYANGSRIVVGGMDQATKIMSSEYDIAYVQEAIELTVDDWEAITTRLRNGKMPYQQLVADTNPSQPKHWLKARCDEGKTQLLESRHADNPRYVLDDGTHTEEGAAYMATLDNLTGVRKLRLKDGLWVAAEGIIYEGFDPAVHVVDRRPVPETWARLWSVDFGFTNPFVWQDWAIDPDGRLILVREVYRTKTLVEDHAEAILQLVTKPVPGVERHPKETTLDALNGGRRRWAQPRPQAVVCDHDAEDRATLERHLGLGTTAARKNVSAGIQAVATRLKPAGDGRPRLMLMRDTVARRDADLVEAKKPASTEEEIAGYVWAVKPGGDLKEEPLKADDHGMDTMRYAVAHLDLGVKLNVRWL